MRARSAHGVRSGDKTDEAPTPGSFTFPRSLPWTPPTWSSTARSVFFTCACFTWNHYPSLIPHRLSAALLWQLNLFTGSCISITLFHTPVIFLHLPFTLLAHIHLPVPIHLKRGDIILNHSNELKQCRGFLTIPEFHMVIPNTLQCMFIHEHSNFIYIQFQRNV